MTRLQEIYTDARIELIRMFIENYAMEESDLDDPNAENPPPFHYEPDFFIF